MYSYYQGSILLSVLGTTYSMPGYWTLHNSSYIEDSIPPLYLHLKLMLRYWHGSWKFTYLDCVCFATMSSRYLVGDTEGVGATRALTWLFDPQVYVRVILFAFDPQVYARVILFAFSAGKICVFSGHWAPACRVVRC